MNQLHSDNSSGTHNFHILGFLAHGRITQEVRATIREGHNYLVKEIAADGEEKTDEYSGGMLRAKYADIFANWKHGFIVIEKGSEIPVFVYAGPIPDKVSSILGINTNKIIH